MKRLRLYLKVCGLFLKRKLVTKEDIGNSYSRVSEGYESSYLQAMHVCNDRLIGRALDLTGSKNDLRILDLACGSGYNIRFLKEHCRNCRYDAVDISSGMLSRIPECEDTACHRMDMLSFLNRCEADTYDLIVCSWALKYQDPKKIIRRCRRILKKNGLFAVIVNTRRTLPEVRKIYPRLLADNVLKIKKLMTELPNPENENQFNRWFTANGFMRMHSESGEHVFSFDGSEKAVDFVASTGALAGFDVMIDLYDAKTRQQMADLFRQYGFKTVTHRFVSGIYLKKG